MLKKPHKTLVDIRHPKKRIKPSKPNLTSNSSKEIKDIFSSRSARYFDDSHWKPRPALKVESRPNRLLSLIKYSTLSILILILGYSIYLLVTKDDSIASAKSIYANLKLVNENIAALKTESVDGLLSKINSDISTLQGKTTPLNLAPVLDQIPATLALVGEISKSIGKINADINAIKSSALKEVLGETIDNTPLNSTGNPKAAQNPESENKLTSLLKDISANLKKLNELTNNLRNIAAKFNIVSSNADQEYFKATTDLNRAIELLDAVITILELPGERHYLVMFQNSTEIRPSGGFVGSYADLVIKNGKVTMIDVNDIYYPRHFSSYKIVPPTQLQSITTNWGPQDANWFFNFPTSAKKISEFIEASSIYADKKIIFDGVIGLNVRIVEDLLKITGPIEVPEYQMILNAENFLSEVQREVETGRDKIPGQNPKKVLKFIVPKIIEKLSHLDEKGYENILNAFNDRFQRKDIQIYFRDPVLENLAIRYEAGGEVYELPKDFGGEYLAVVNTNVAGGKSDAFIDQRIKLDTYINTLGEIANNLTLTRSHSGQNEKDWWYRSKNQNFVKIFTTSGTQFQDLEGNTNKTINPAINYVANKYKIDPDLDRIQRTKKILEEFNAATYIENGKTVLGAWFTVEAGKTKDLVLEYKNPKSFSVTTGSKFQFIFEKQSGVDSKLEYTIEAPAGFKWRESDSQTFIYSTDRVTKRIIIDLTLEEDIN